MLACQARDPGFKSRPRRHYLLQYLLQLTFGSTLLQYRFAISNVNVNTIINVIINIDVNMIINVHACVIMNARTIVNMSVRSWGFDGEGTVGCCAPP